ncbi:PREDICTED: putative odorant-binding protein A10 isoform X1 [Rhagoletis zephyria]|uniref:putative odorant-binding protein A10 isoform X1 n=1 Tax=Rhagoletis zephyria TaxID=28612 RepID=UPI0008119CD2|nr:PREDICTED: putative odorant-binding protein A10 isoform X1 [Rhagoletis zephyria]XP_036319257.1 putative odorant-binding protein A10 isoform X1 [Rhagoletis pomonella]
MRFLVAFVLIYIAYYVAGIGAAPHPPATTSAPLVANQATYDTRFDNIDLDEVLSQERLLRNYIKCLENTGPCTSDSKMLKEILPDAISTDCVKCSPKQKSGSAKVTHFLIDNRPEDWARLEQIYDPQGSYRLAYLAEKAKNGDDKQNTTEAETKA